ncbi:MAG: antitoxin [Parcubacteria group bacterium CG_4_9_14_0_2_um_filter_41_8]|nr:MAG: antitoxin [Parcubacteria group bacterium CG11_big_fil_rev_8_21_14_0_20_41_14]PIR57063.1 MAG: antitoxin [Parcubacteria group bacterium CG10_big_fil_rev_8_21_14_0_10_41_35]PJC40364.1 MAG: antitoxin [Parcubacteria group bacterium CG_4_9_14_0_2_um_filter_41_8]
MTEDLEKKYYHTFDEEEKELIESYNKGEWKRVPNLEEEKKKLVAVARATIAMRKNKNVNIRISEGDLRDIKIKAQERGLPYQTFIASILHQFSNGRIKEVV